MRLLQGPSAGSTGSSCPASVHRAAGPSVLNEVRYLASDLRSAADECKPAQENAALLGETEGFGPGYTNKIHRVP